MTLQQSALHPVAAGSGARFEAIEGWELPKAYTDAAAEYAALTASAAVYDNSRMGRLKATGADALDLINRLSTNNVVDLTPGQGAPTILTTDRGRILDLIGVMNVDDYVLLLTSPGAQQQVIDWLDRYTIMEDLVVEDVTSQDTMLSVLGPESAAVLAQVSPPVEADGLLPYHSILARISGYDVRIISRPLGELPNFDLLLSHEAAAIVWECLVAAGITPAGEDAFQAMRMDYAVPVLGRELGDSYNPLEAGLIGSIDFAKGCYIGQEVIARLDTYQKVQKHLARLRFSADAQISQGDLLRSDGRDVGLVTSVARIPTDGQVIGLGYVRKANARIGAVLELANGSAEITALPQMFGPGQD